MSYEEDLAAWASLKLGEEVEVGTVTIDMETRYGGYCETCSYEDEVVALKATSVTGARLVQDLYTDLGTIIREIYAAGER